MVPVPSSLVKVGVSEEVGVDGEFVAKGLDGGDVVPFWREARDVGVGVEKAFAAVSEVSAASITSSAHEECLEVGKSGNGVNGNEDSEATSCSSEHGGRDDGGTDARNAEKSTPLPLSDIVDAPAIAAAIISRLRW